ncbi:hypothetical protein DVH24_042136 [Malus domestica]|uniref:Uncharacterized protein n=1 Tax=Malus domestica TaxID=3750 RepID=A0A498J0A9_MALDO|nr:hypothetical protein DVH24_042136 [Malus domestica]
MRRKEGVVQMVVVKRCRVGVVRRTRQRCFFEEPYRSIKEPYKNLVPNTRWFINFGTEKLYDEEKMKIATWTELGNMEYEDEEHF